MAVLTLAAVCQVRNPILPGFNPDPSVCRVGDDYYICCSSFTWYPGLPIYHSRDLVNWKLVAHAIDRPGMVTLDGLKDKDGVWAPTIRHHDGTWYIFCNVSNRGNFYITAKDVRGPWSNPVFVEDAPGIDPSVFWDDDGRAYMMANSWEADARAYYKTVSATVPSSTAIWMQEIDLGSGKLLGERRFIAIGHALNAKYTEGAHLYKTGGRYVLTLAEGGTDANHAATILTSKNLWGPYIPQTVNPVLSQRQFGYDYPLQCVGHIDLVQTPRGDWYSVALGKRMIDGRHSFTRETFICPVEIQQGEFIFNPGRGGITLDIPRPNLPEHTVEQPADKDDFDGMELSPVWSFNRIPRTVFHSLDGGRLVLNLQKESIDSLVCPAMIIRRVTSHRYSATTRLSFSTKKPGERAGLVLHRNNTAYVALLKTAGGLAVVESGKTTATIPYEGDEVCLRLRADGINAVLEYGETADDMRKAAGVSLLPLTDDRRLNRFNGTGIGVYASSYGTKSSRKAAFDYFYYENE